jgi:RNA polymerase subunit RPABC4/transcription elongation factor Spt4
LGERHLLLRHCADCSPVQYDQRAMCRACGGERLTDNVTDEVTLLRFRKA